MIDRYLLPLVKKALNKPADMAVKRGITADQVTLAGFVIGAFALPALAFELYPLALILIIINRIFDGLDGEIARHTHPTDRGAFLDISLDFLFYALIPLGFAIARPENALPAAFLIASFIGTGTSFLAFSLIAERRGLASDRYSQKGIYYLGGLTEGTETIAIFIAFCLFPNHFVPLATGFACLCLITAALRLWQGWNAFDTPLTKTKEEDNEKTA